MPPYEYKFTKKAFRQLQKLDPQARKRIFEKLDYYCAKTNPLIYADRVSDPRIGQYRFRIGDYRAAFDVEACVLKILKVGHRKDIYR